ncbi:MAG: NERD domain-containing protein [Blastochloris sp.]|nr:NERD domain-containing protein [Blastochloris sp.]
MKKAGQSSRDMQQGRCSLRKFACLFGLGVMLIVICILLMGLRFGGVASILITLGCILVMKFIKVDLGRDIDFLIKREGHASRGAAAEEKIGELLDSLDPARFQVFHDVVLGYGNIDHLVVRRDGALFVIETKSHYGTITHDGHELLRDGYALEKDFIKQTLKNVLTLRSHVQDYAEREIWVNGVLCFTQGFVKVRKPVQGIQLLPGKWLLNHLQEGQAKAANAEIADWLWENVATLVTLPPKTSPPPLPST